VSLPGVGEVIADKGYHSNELVRDLANWEFEPISAPEHGARKLPNPRWPDIFGLGQYLTWTVLMALGQKVTAGPWPFPIERIKFYLMPYCAINQSRQRVGGQYARWKHH